VRLKEFASPSNNKQQLNEWIPLAIMAAGAAWTAYDTWKMKKAYDRGEISAGDMAKAIGTDAALTLAGGAAGKLAGKGWKAWKRYWDAKKSVGVAKPLTKAELKKDKILKKAEAKVGKDIRIQNKKNTPKTSPERGKWTSRARLLLAPFGAKAANEFRKLSPEAQKIKLDRLEVAKQRQIKKDIDDTRDRIRKSEEGDAPTSKDTTSTTKKTKKEIELEKADRRKWKKKYDDSPEGKAAAQKHLDDVNARIAARKQTGAAAKKAREAEINQYRLGRAQEIDTALASSKEKVLARAATADKGLPSGAIRTTTSTSPNLDALNRVVQRASKKNIKGTEHAVDAGKAISRGIENTL
jgi:hypothetical protein